MLSRRHFLTMATAIAVGTQASAQRGESTTPPHWRRYREVLAIDGEAGLGVFQDDGLPLGPALDAVRASGLSSVLLTVGPAGRYWLNDAQFENTKHFIRKCKLTIAAHPKALMLISNPGDLHRARRDGRLGFVLRFQGTEPLGEDSDRIPLFRQLGVRVIQLTHNRRNLVGDGCMEPGNAGLSRYGHEVVERLNAEKVVVDLAHGAQRTIAEGIGASKAPVLISHTGCRALSDLPRNVGDAELKAMADRGGVAGIIFWPYLRTREQPMAIDVIRHIEHAIDVCGEDHVGIGTDGSIEPTARTPEFEQENRKNIQAMTGDGIFSQGRPADLYLFIPDLNVPDRFDVLAGMLSKRGHSDSRIEKLLGANFARVMTEVWGG